MEYADKHKLIPGKRGISCRGEGGLHTFVVVADFGFDDFRFFRVTEPAFDAVQSYGVDAVVHHDVVIPDVRNKLLPFFFFRRFIWRMKASSSGS